MELSAEIDIVAVQAITFHTIREPWVYDVFKISQTCAKAFFKALILDAVQNVNPWLSVFCCGNQYDVLSFFVGGASHEDNLVTLLWNGINKLGFRDDYSVSVIGERGYFNPITLDVVSGPSLTSYKVSNLKGILLLKLDDIVFVLFINVHYLAIT